MTALSRNRGNVHAIIATDTKIATLARLDTRVDTTHLQMEFRRRMND